MIKISLSVWQRNVVLKMNLLLTELVAVNRDHIKCNVIVTPGLCGLDIYEDSLLKISGYGV